MGHDKLRKFAENETFACLVQPDSKDLLADGYLNLRDHEIKGKWAEFFKSLGGDPSKPIVLELGCGKGEYTVDLAMRDPSRNYIGVDIKGARLWKGAKFATQQGLTNVAFLRTRIEFISAFFGKDEVSEIWLTFSDPQFRSENSRLTSPVFLERYRPFLKPGGLVHLKTDSMFLHQYTRAVCKVNGFEVLKCTGDLYGTDPKTLFGEEISLDDRAVFEVQTFYEKMFLEQGYKITYMRFRIDHEGPFAKVADPEDFDTAYWRSVEGPRLLFGHDSAETRRQKLASGEPVDE